MVCQISVADIRLTAGIERSLQTRSPSTTGKVVSTRCEKKWRTASAIDISAGMVVTGEDMMSAATRPENSDLPDEVAHRVALSKSPVTLQMIDRKTRPRSPVDRAQSN